MCPNEEEHHSYISKNYNQLETFVSDLEVEAKNLENLLVFFFFGLDRFYLSRQFSEQHFQCVGLGRIESNGNPGGFWFLESRKMKMSPLQSLC